MNTFTTVVEIELKKALRSKMPLFTALGFLFIPLGIAFLMFIYKNPELARGMGIVGAKANLAAATADWPTFLGMLTQAIALAGYILFTIIGGWVFGREFADHTLKDLLALPVSRSTILFAKFVVIAVWCVAVVLLSFIISLVIGFALGLPQGSADVLLRGGSTLAVTTILVIAIMTPAALFASIGRGYLLPVGIGVLTLMMANILAVAGWANYVPWSIPAMYAEIGGQSEGLEPVSYFIVLLTGLVGIAGTYLWWNRADQSR